MPAPGHHHEAFRESVTAGPSGPPGNANGSVLRITTAHGDGPAREIHAGGGYWSQDSAVVVMRAAGRP
jgi:hypothetical protein